MKIRVLLLIIAALLIVCITACNAKTKEPDTAEAGTVDAVEETAAKPKRIRTPSTPSNNVDEGFIITPEEVHIEPGDMVEVNIRVENRSNREAARFEVRVDNDKFPIRGATITMEDTFCYALQGFNEYQLVNDTWRCDNHEELLEIDASQPVCQFWIKIPADAKPGEYMWTIESFHVVENFGDEDEDIERVEFDAVIRPGWIIVED